MNRTSSRSNSPAAGMQECGSPVLTVVMPVYNEEGAIRMAVEEWTAILNGLNIDYEFSVLNDGSRDGTAAILDGIAARLPRLRVTHKSNSGHGPTILRGYREARGEWVFQTDSDRELKPDAFARLWAKRGEYDYIQAYRINRKSPLARRITTSVAGWTVRLLFGSGLRDINCPYRLMRGDWVRRAAVEIPPETLTPNVILPGLAIRDNLRTYEEPVEHSHRKTGTVSIRKWKLCKFAARAFCQVLRLAFGGKRKLEQ